MAQPAKYVGAVWKSQRDGEVRESTLIALTDAEETWRNLDGCEFSRPTTDFGPDYRWSGCGGADGSQEVSVNGSIWPIQVGSTVSYDFKGKNNDGDTWNGTRRCEVKEEARVTVPAGSYDTFHVVCEDPWRSRHWYVSPELEVSVLYWDRHKRRNETRRSELISWEPGGTS